MNKSKSSRFNITKQNTAITFEINLLPYYTKNKIFLNISRTLTAVDSNKLADAKGSIQVDGIDFNWFVSAHVGSNKEPLIVVY